MWRASIPLQFGGAVRLRGVVHSFESDWLPAVCTHRIHRQSSHRSVPYACISVSLLASQHVPEALALKGVYLFIHLTSKACLRYNLKSLASVSFKSPDKAYHLSFLHETNLLWDILVSDLRWNEWMKSVFCLFAWLKPSWSVCSNHCTAKRCRIGEGSNSGPGKNGRRPVVPPWL